MLHCSCYISPSHTSCTVPGHCYPRHDGRGTQLSLGVHWCKVSISLHSKESLNVSVHMKRIRTTLLCCVYSVRGVSKLPSPCSKYCCLLTAGYQNGHASLWQQLQYTNATDITWCTILQEARTEVLQDTKPVWYSKHWCTNYIASYPGLLAPAFVACSTNAGEGLVKLSHVVWRTWTCGGVAHSRRNSK